MPGRDTLNSAAQRLLGRSLTAAELLEVSRRCDAMGIRDEDVSLYFLLSLVDQRAALQRASRRGAYTTNPSTLIRRHWRLIASLAMALVATHTMVAWTATSTAYDRGFAAREKLIEKENAWLVTPAGQAARAIHDGGFATYLADCSLPGWSQTEQVCQPGIDPISKRMWGFAVKTTSTP